MRIVWAAILYFVIVFLQGFILGVIRTIWAVPRYGNRTAELMEAPFMLIVIFFSAGFVAGRLGTASTNEFLAVGLLGLVFLIAAELSLLPLVRGIPIREYFASRDRIAATVFYILLGIFAFMPVFLSRK